MEKKKGVACLTRLWGEKGEETNHIVKKRKQENRFEAHALRRAKLKAHKSQRWKGTKGHKKRSPAFKRRPDLLGMQKKQVNI